MPPLGVGGDLVAGDVLLFRGGKTFVGRVVYRGDRGAGVTMRLVVYYSSSEVNMAEVIRRGSWPVWRESRGEVVC